MKHLYDSSGNHVATEKNGVLYSPNGVPIGKFLKNESIFVDKSGRYLGEIVSGDRLAKNKSSSHSNQVFNTPANAPGASIPNAPNGSAKNLPSSFEDIDIETD